MTYDQSLFGKCINWTVGCPLEIFAGIFAEFFSILKIMESAQIYHVLMDSHVIKMMEHIIEMFENH